jgi:hypothetical protein
MSRAENRKAVESLVIGTFAALDRTGLNPKKYLDFFSSLSDDQFAKWLESFLADEDENFFLEVIPHRNEPSFPDIEKAAKILGIQLEERVVFPHSGGIMTRTPVPVGWLMLKRHQQIVSKKNSIANSVRTRNQRTGQVTGDSKAARESDMENYALQTIGAKHALKEMMGARADDSHSKQQMYGKISTEGFVQAGELKPNPDGKVALNTISVLFLGAGIRTDLVSNSLMLNVTTRSPRATAGSSADREGR